ncbi:MAG TPA: beta-mannosidase, partial [Verrucomicrobiales bacterium]|nr:beta-mannosidase [Verrucomicrobiales bacterium]
MKHLFRLNTLIAAGLLAVCGSQAAPSFYTSGSNIKDANDNTFVIRGMN